MEIMLESMARQPRIQSEGPCYHVMCRGDRQEPIFEGDRNRVMFLETLREVCERSARWGLNMGSGEFFSKRTHGRWALAYAKVE